MKLFRKLDKDEMIERLPREVDLFQEAWLNRVGLSRFVRTIAIIFIAYLAATAQVQINSRKSCDNGKPLLSSFLSQQRGVIARQKKLLRSEIEGVQRQNALDSEEAAEHLTDILKPAVKVNCTQQYPIVPWIGI